jgi:hypothetical protein
MPSKAVAAAVAVGAGAEAVKVADSTVAPFPSTTLTA